MPIYEYKCAVCGHITSILEKISPPKNPYARSAGQERRRRFFPLLPLIAAQPGQTIVKVARAVSVPRECAPAEPVLTATDRRKNLDNRGFRL